MDPTSSEIAEVTVTVVCRELDVPCVVGTGVDTVTSLRGQVVTVDASAGLIHLGALPIDPPTGDDDPALATLRSWLSRDSHDDRSVVALLEARTNQEHP